MPTKDKDLEPVSDLNMVRRYLQYGLEFHEIVSCYIEDVNLHFDAAFNSIDPDKLVLDLEISNEHFTSLNSSQFAAIDRLQGEIRLSYSVNEATFFAHTKFQGRNANRIVVKADMPMYKLQRREAMRIRVMESHKATIKLGSVTLPLFDISATGLSIVVNIDEVKNYEKQQMFTKSILSFLGKDIQVDLQVQNVLGASKDGLKWKIGFRFKALPASVEQMIAREAYLHSHKIWGRWI